MRDIPKPIALAAFAALALLAVSAYLAHVGFATLRDSVRWEVQSQEVRSSIATLLGAIQGAEGAQRGYALTGNAGLLHIFEDTSTRAFESILHLKSLTNDNPAQQARIDEIADLWRARHSMALQVTNAVEAGRQLEAKQRVRGGAGTRTSARLREILAEMDHAESAWLEERRNHASRHELLMRASLVGLALLGTLVVTGFYFQIKREFARRLAVTEALAQEKALADQRLAELQAANERIESADRVKTTLLHTASHELRTPLNHIIGFSSLLLERCHGLLGQEDLKQIALIRHAGHQMLGLVTNLLDAAMAEGGALVVETRPIEVGPLLQEIVSTHAAANTREAVSLRLVPDDSAQIVIADPPRLYHIIDNMLANAVRFTEHGIVSVETSTTASGTVRISVRDQGCGVAQSERARLFKAFERGRDGTLRTHAGLGLGLSVSRKLAVAMGGDMGHEDNDGHGSVFWVELPAPRWRPDASPASTPVLRSSQSAARAAAA